MKKKIISGLWVCILFWSGSLVASVGNYLDFNGSSNYVSCGNPASLQISGALTIEAWIYCESVTGDGNVIVSRAIESETEAGNILYQFRILSDRTLRLMWEAGAGNNYYVESAAGVISNNTWHHVAAVRDVGSSSSAVRLFVDGTLIKSASATNPSGGTDVNQRVWIGANYQDGTYRYWFNGKIDEVRIWNVVRSVAQIQTNMYSNLEGNESGLVGYWKFDENTGSTVYDETANSNNGSISGASWVTGNLTIGADATFQVDITTSTDWRADQVNVRSNIWVLSGATLRIFPGTTVQFSETNTRGLIVENGRLLAVGTADHPILFTPADKTSRKWFGIRFKAVPTSNDSSKIEFSKIEYATSSSADWNKYGAGISVRDFSKVKISNCIIDHNCCSYSYGGGIYLYNAPITIVNTVISNNTAQGRNGIYLLGSYSQTAIIKNCTICNNISGSSYDGDGIFCDTNTQPNISNCIVYGNTSGGYAQIAGPSHNVTYSNVQYGYSGTGNINANPVFVSTSDYRLQATSPCINAGNATTTGVPSTDYDGNPRIYDGLVDRIDMGAFEYQGDAAPIITAHPANATKHRDESATFSVTATGVSLSYQWRKNSGNIGGATSTSYTIASVAESDEASYDCVVTSGNASSTSNAATLTVNDAPTDIALSSVTINENLSSGTAVGTLSSTDPDASDTHTYTLVSGTGDTDNASFTISGNNLQSATVFDYEVKSSYSVRIRTTDNGSPGLTYEEAFTITIVNVNDTPTDIGLSNATIDENQSSGTTVGILSTIDQDAGASHTYSLVTGDGSTDNGSFTISGNNLQSATVFDYEVKSSYSVRIRTIDNGSPGLSYEEAFAITVNDVNESPTDISLSSLSIDENKATGTTVGTLSTTDQDAGSSHTYTLVSGDGDDDNTSFSISGSDLLSANIFDYETKSSYSVRIQSTDNGSPGLTYAKAFTILINDIQEDNGASYALDFDGVDEYVSVGDWGSFTTATIEFWMRGDDVSNSYYQGLVSSDGWDTGYLHLPVGNNKIEITLHLGDDSRGRLTSTTLSNGNWYHVAVTMDVNVSDGFCLYLNGVLQDSDDISSLSNVILNSMVIGRENVSLRYFDGVIDEVRVWSVVRTEDEIRSNMHRIINSDETGLFAYWRFNEGNGFTTVNACGNSSFHGTLVNMEEADWFVSPVACALGSNHSCCGVTNAASVLGNLVIAPTDAFDNEVDLYVNELMAVPNTFSGISGSGLSDRYWVVNIFGTPGTFSANLTFTLPEGYLNTGDSQLQLYRRNSNSIGDWTPVGTLGTVTATTVQFTGITDFSQFTLGSVGESSLPVALTDFTAECQSGVVVLKWTTESETENLGFIIEKRIREAGDWIQVADYLTHKALEGHGSTSVKHVYQYTDKAVQAGFAYQYRLADVDYSGNIIWHAKAEIHVPTEGSIIADGYILNPVYPNPFNATLTVPFSISEPMTVSIEIYSITGQRMMTVVNREFGTGSYNYTVQADDLASGIYLIKTSFGKKTHMQKAALLK